MVNKEETKRMKVLADISQENLQNNGWMNVKAVKKTFCKRAKLAEHPVEKVGANLRAMMPWIENLMDSDKS